VRKLEGRKKAKKGPKQMNVRFMMPFTMCCSSCHEFHYVGTKFNSRVEKLQDEDYLGIAIWRFYGKCPSCSTEFCFKTDPENTAYILEYGGTRTYDPHRDASIVEESVKDRFRREMEGDAMKSLEHKTSTTANELLDLEQLDELRRMNKRLLHQTDLTDEVLVKVIQAHTISPTAAQADDAELAVFRKEQNSLAKCTRGDDSSSDDDCCRLSIEGACPQQRLNTEDKTTGNSERSEEKTTGNSEHRMQNIEGRRNGSSSSSSSSSSMERLSSGVKANMVCRRKRPPAGCLLGIDMYASDDDDKDS